MTQIVFLARSGDLGACGISMIAVVASGQFLVIALALAVLDE